MAQRLAREQQPGHMVTRSLRHLFYTVAAAVGLVLALSALVLLAKTSNNSAELDRLSQLTLVINGVGIAIMSGLLLGNIIRLIRDLRRQVPGARLKSRMVAAFIGLALLPLSVVYYFSLQFINRGIDSWFSVQVEQGLDDALELSRAAMDVQMRNGLRRTQAIARRVERQPSSRWLQVLAEEREVSGALELVIFSGNSRILALSSERSVSSVPLLPTDEVLMTVRASRPYFSLDLLEDDQYEVRTAVPLIGETGSDMRILQAVYPVTQRLSGIVSNVRQSYADYRRLVLLRTPLKSTFTLSLTVVLLVSALAAIYGAFFFSRRLVAPIQQLVAGTEAVAKGNLETELAPPPRDEIGVLVSSFNDMTRRLRAARDEAQRIRGAVETERANLETILARLSTGVIALTPELEVRTANAAAADILGVDIDHRRGERLADVAEGELLLGQLYDIASAHFASGETEWREQVMLREPTGRRVLTCACTELTTDSVALAGFVIVFDDITTLLEAQRDAAWGEVARRLAHEIKNPLTPIQLSAERLRRKYLEQLPVEDSQMLDRATHTIVQQVEAMKEMVNAFSDYARTPDLQISRFSLQRLAAEIEELYRAEAPHLHISLSSNPDLPPIEADNGRVRQMLHNLLRNAVEALAGRQTGTIEVRLDSIERFGQPMVEIRVTDDGPGFQTTSVHQVFDPYVTSKPKGTGLGLAIVRKLVEEHAGTISAGNRLEGGAEISIVLPLNETAREAMLTRTPRRSESRRVHS
ncbi:MAG: ATP-binding protein [Pseudomonadota bacterium]